MHITEMSFSGAVLILAIVTVRVLAVNRLPKKTFSALWGIALLRLLLPFAVPSVFSIYSLVKKLLPRETMMMAPYSSGEYPHAVRKTMEYMIAAPGGRQTQASLPYRTVFWIAGMAVCALFFFILYYRCQRKFKASRPIWDVDIEKWLSEHKTFRRIEIRQSDQVSAPLTYGIVRPVILLPDTIRSVGIENLKYMLVHEYIHIRRFDVAAKLILIVAVCVHWFNPFVWVMYFFANRDMELSCDEAVVNWFGVDSRRGYALAILQMAEIQSGIHPLCSNFSKNALEERIEAIMKTKKSTWVSGLAAAALAITVTAVFATSANATEKNPGFIGVLDEEDTLIENVEWWTAEDYAAWLEEEKIQLRSIIGDRSWNPTDGWYIWTQELVDETIAKYEQILKEIQSGSIMISRPTADGDTCLMLGYDPVEITVETEEEISLIREQEPAVSSAVEEAEAVAVSSAVEEAGAVSAMTEDACETGDIDNVADSLARYAPFGVTFVKSGDFGRIYWNGELVDVLEDDAPDGTYTSASSSGEGGIKIQTVYDSSGKLIGIEPVEN